MKELLTNITSNGLYLEIKPNKAIYYFYFFINIILISVCSYGTKFLKLLKESEQDDIPVRVYLRPGTNQIWWVEEEVRNYEAAKTP